MHQFAYIHCSVVGLPPAIRSSSSLNTEWTCNSFELQINLDIPTFEGALDGCVFNGWIWKLEHYLIQTYFDPG